MMKLNSVERRILRETFEKGTDRLAGLDVLLEAGDKPHVFDSFKVAVRIFCFTSFALRTFFRQAAPSKLVLAVAVRLSKGSQHP